MARAKRKSWSFSYLDILLLAVPVAIALRYVPGWASGAALFIVSAIAIIPLGGWMGRATEQLAARSGSGIGGFLNATFGNAAELIIALVALSKGLTGVVKGFDHGLDHRQSPTRAGRVDFGRRDSPPQTDLQPHGRPNFPDGAGPGRNCSSRPFFIAPPLPAEPDGRSRPSRICRSRSWRFCC